MPRIFERFYRGSLANEARGSGSGLGLAIVKSIVDLHAGRITVESRLGAGTTVVVTLPRDPRTAEVGGARDDTGGPRGPRADFAGPADSPTGEVADSSPSDQS
jgi:hypothetical protein